MHVFFSSLVIFFFAITPALAQKQQVQAQRVDMEELVTNTVMINCIIPFVKGESVLEIAEAWGFEEFAKNKAALYLESDGGGRAFLVTGSGGNIILKVADSGSCGVAVHEINAIKLWEQIYKIFDPKTTPWKFMEEDQGEDVATEKYMANFGGTVVAFVSVRDKPVKNQLQSLVTIIRYEDPTRR